MRFGYFNITMGKGRTSQRQIYEDFLSDAALAEELNFDAVWLAEHHFNADFCLSPAPNLLLAAVAATTKRIKIGSCVNVLPMYNPVRLIEEIAELDLLSNGRFQWGIGRGSPAMSSKAMGSIRNSRWRCSGKPTMRRCMRL